MVRTSVLEQGKVLTDFLPTPKWATQILLNRVTFNGSIWEPACGNGKMSKVIKSAGYKVISTDKFNHGYGKTGIDFLKEEKTRGDNIATNPPFKYAEKFVTHALSLDGVDQVAMLLRTLFVESKRRRNLFENHKPERIIYICDRVMFDGHTEEPGGGFSVSWFVWKRGFRGQTKCYWAYFDGL